MATAVVPHCCSGASSVTYTHTHTRYTHSFQCMHCHALFLSNRACSQNQSLYRATRLDMILLSFGIDLNGLFANATNVSVYEPLLSTLNCPIT